MSNLLKFKEYELLFNDAETIMILKFFFRGRHSEVDRIVVTNRVREFAQGLLIESVNVSYTMGFIDIVFDQITSPVVHYNGVKKLFYKLGKESFKHWFKSGLQKDLLQVEIYNTVRDRLAFNFSYVLTSYANNIAIKNPIARSELQQVT